MSRNRNSSSDLIPQISNKEPSNFQSMPRNVKIGYARYKVEATPKGRISKEKLGKQKAKWLGECITNKSLIRIWKYQSKEELANTLLHEIAHAIVWNQGLNLENEVEEDVVIGMTNGLCALIKDNPELIKWLQKSLK